MASTLEQSHSNRLILLHNVPTVEADPYASGDLLGGKQELLNAVELEGDAGLIRGVRLVSSGAFSNQVDCIFFNADPSNTTFTENASLALDSADDDKIIGGIKVDTFFQFDSNGFAQSAFGDLHLPFIIPSGTSLFMAMITRGAITPGSTSGLEVRVTIERY